ncbi:MAG: Mrp/NBP35 family ATP-binding protein, partial [Acidimicrobiales bacterium]
MEQPITQWIIELARDVLDPELQTSVVDLGMIRDVHFDEENGRVDLTISLTTIGCPLRSEIQRRLREAIESDERVQSCHFSVVEMDQVAKRRAMQIARERASERDRSSNIGQSTQVLAISSGKGGVGKSSIATNLALAFAHKGYRVGLLDADIWGYSVTTMIGRSERAQVEGTKDSWKIQPQTLACGEGSLKFVSMGQLATSENDAIMWRGPMLSRAFQHFVSDVAWGVIDYLIIDMPPGTGDIHLTLARLLPQAEVVIVTTPAKNAATVASRVGDMSTKANLTLAGVVENMSYFRCQHGERYEIFGSGGGQEVASRLNIALLGKMPFSEDLGQFDGTESDLFTSLTLSASQQAVKDALVELCETLDAHFQERTLNLLGCT